MMTADQLREFETQIADDFNAGRIKAPVHFAGGNEDQLIEIFKNIRPQDWVLGTWRSHYHCLLKGVPPDELRTAILKGRSIALSFPSYKVLSSAIVGGICPISVGLGWAIKEKRADEWVHAFVGDMAAESGIFHECSKYAAKHALPVTWHVEDNGKSVCTDTQRSWGGLDAWPLQGDVWRYKYDLPHAHVGTGKWVAF
jgi:TPP-dependent pyruvate/acetoin dehydrogenase alpha subunit